MPERGSVLSSLQRASVLFWDFDGVIKESVDIKTRAYVALFEPFGAELAERVRAHHERNGGMSRLQKIPLYLDWAGVAPTQDEVERYCGSFAATVRERVISCAWVPGAREYLAHNHTRQRCVLISATPHEEMMSIIEALGMSGWFCEVHGAPKSKSAAVSGVLQRWACAAEQALLIGDSAADFEAARSAGVPFLLRRTPLNAELQGMYHGPQCEDFLNG
jgi:phosphoglycolate phosphatase-like HAD superfamily hydrolase